MITISSFSSDTTNPEQSFKYRIANLLTKIKDHEVDILGWKEQKLKLVLNLNKGAFYPQNTVQKYLCGINWV